MPDKLQSREPYGEAFRRKHHEAWQQSALNQREYCEAQGIPLKAFGNWRAKFNAEPRLPTPKLLYRRRGLSHTLSHMTNDLPDPIVPPAREGHRRTFSEADKRRIVEETARPGASLWPSNVEPGGTLMLTSAQLSMLIDGVDWRAPS